MKITKVELDEAGKFRVWVCVDDTDTLMLKYDTIIAQELIFADAQRQIDSRVIETTEVVTDAITG